MGSSNLGDCLTGLTIGNGDPVVAFVIDRTRGGFPDAEKTRAMTGRFFNSVCQLVSLPIVASYGGYNDIVPDEGQLSVAIACQMVGVKDWGEFAGTALDFQRGAAIQRDRRIDRVLGAPPPEPQVFGLAVMHRSSWNHLMAMQAAHLDREADVGMVAWAMEDVARRYNAQGKNRDDRLYVQQDSVLGLRSWTYTGEDGEEVTLPDVATALSSGRDLFGHDFIEWLRDRLIEPSLIGDRAPGAPWLRELIGGLWDARAFEHGMDWHNRTLLSSPSAGQQRAAERHFALAMLAMEQASGPLVESISDNGEEPEDVAKLNAMMAHLDGLRGRIADRIAAARDSHAAYMTGIERGPR